MRKFNQTVEKAERWENRHLKNKVFFELISGQYKTRNNGEFTADMVNNWFYGRSENEVIQSVYQKVVSKSNEPVTA